MLGIRECVYVFQTAQTGWRAACLYSYNVMIFEWVLICTEASPVVLRAGEECLAYLS